MTQSEQTALAIIGMSCRLPGANSLEQYWELIRDGRSAIGEIPRERFNRDLYFHPEKGQRGKSYSSLAALASWPDCPSLGEKLANTSDPAHVSFCQVATEAWNQARLKPGDRGVWQNTGVYVGHTVGSQKLGLIAHATMVEQTAAWLREIPAFQQYAGDRADDIIRSTVDTIRQQSPRHNPDGSPHLSVNQVAILVSTLLQLSGPSMAVNAACASSQIALSIAARALHERRINAAIVGGTSYFKPGSLILFSRAQSVSSTGSRPFDRSADGLIIGEGTAAMVICRLEDAIAFQTPIHAVIRSVAISSDGRGKSLWAPRREGQIEAVRRAHGTKANSVAPGYIEAHATSTQVGDATELAALTEVFASQPAGSIPVGSVKANIGHTLEVAGIAGVLKAVLAMKHETIPPAINVQALNSNIDWKTSPLRVPVAAEHWAPPVTADGHRCPRRAAVNSFGIGGLNGHVVLEEFLPDAPSQQTPSQSVPAIAVHNSVRRTEPIAVIGASAMLPGANNLDEFQDLLQSGRNAKTRVPEERWNAVLGCETDQPTIWRSLRDRGGFITKYAYDWRRHKVPPKQVENADPLQFMLLDMVDNALIDAGYEDRDFPRKQTGVVVGNGFGSDFSLQLEISLRLPWFRQVLMEQLSAHGGTKESAADVYEQFERLFLQRFRALLDETGSYSTSTLASRITKTFNLMGGAVAIDAGKLSSSAALTICVDMLRGHHCDLMICAAGQRSMDLESYQQLSLSGALVDPETGRDVEEMLPGEGGGVLLLKRLADARRDGNRVRAVIGDIQTSSSRDITHTISRLTDDNASRKPERHITEVSLAGIPDRLKAATAAIKKSFPVDDTAINQVARQIGNLNGASGMAALMKCLLQLQRSAEPTSCLSVFAPSNGRISQAALVNLIPEESPVATDKDLPTVIQLQGTPYEMGLAHGKHEANNIRRLLKRHADLSGYPRGPATAFENWSSRAERWFTSSQLEEMRGIADGANVPQQAILAHNLRTVADISGGGCLQVIISAENRLLHAVNEDQPISVNLPDCLARHLQIRRPDNGFRHIIACIAGQVGGLNGMNERGLSVSSAMLLNGTESVQEGKVHSALISQLLQHSDSIESAVELIRSFSEQSAASWRVIVASSHERRTCYVEYKHGRIEIQDNLPGTFSAANHCETLTAVKPEPRHSIARLQRFRELLKAADWSATTTEAFLRSVLRDRFDGPRGRTPRFTTMNTIQRRDNQLSLIMRPDKGYVLVTSGPRSAAPDTFHRIALKADTSGQQETASVSKGKPPQAANEISPQSHTTNAAHNAPEVSSSNVCQRYVLRMKTIPVIRDNVRTKPLNGTAWVLGDNPTAHKLAAAITSNGGKAVLFQIPDNLEQLPEVLSAQWQDSPAPHLFLMTSMDDSAQTSLVSEHWLQRRTEKVLAPFLFTQRWMKLIQQSSLLNKASLTAATLLGGDFGFSSQVSQLDGGALTGLVKAMHVEFGERGRAGFKSRVVDFSTDMPVVERVQIIQQECRSSENLVEVGYAGAHLRRAVTAVPQKLPTSEQEIAPHGSWIITGGARGVTAAVAKQFARTFPVRLHLLGSSPQPEIDPAWRTFSDEQWQSLRRDICERAARQGKKPIDAWRSIERALEIDANLRQMQAEGIHVVYHACDVSNRDTLATVLNAIRKSDGAIKGVIHGAGFEHSCRFDRKTPQNLERTLSAKVDGAAALMEATASDSLQAFLAFGSVSGRWGSLGQADYCLANDMLAKLVDWYRHQRSDVPAAVFHWPAWGEVGMAVRPETKGLLERFDIQFMPTEEGSRHLIDELMQGLPESEVLIADPQSRNLVTSTTEADEKSPGYPLIDEILPANNTSSITACCHLNPQTDAFLTQHLFRGRPLLPIVIAIEGMLEILSITAPTGQHVQALRNVQALKGLHFHSDRIQTARFIATPKGATANCKVQCDFHNRAGRLMRPNITHFKASAEYSGNRNSTTRNMDDLPTEWQPVRFFSQREQTLYHGPVFHNAHSISLQPWGGWTRLVVPTLNELAGERGVNNWLTSPGLLDSCLYSCGAFAWLCFDRSIAIPHSVDRFQLCSTPEPQQICYQRFQFIQRNEQHITFDFDLFDSAGRLIWQMQGYKTIIVQQTGGQA